MLVNQSKHSRLSPIHTQVDTNQQSSYRKENGKKRLSTVQDADPSFNAEKISKNLSSVAYFIGSLYLLLIATIITGQLLT